MLQFCIEESSVRKRNLVHFILHVEEEQASSYQMGKNTSVRYQDILNLSALKTEASHLWVKNEDTAK